MIPKQFDYFAPTSLDEAIQLLEEHGAGASILAGGHSLIPAMKLRLAAPRVLIDIGRVPGLQYITVDDDHITIGALTTHHQVAVSPEIAGAWSVLSEAAGGIGDPQVRNHGTIGGSLAHADPAADLPPVMMALEAQLEARGPNGTRTIPAVEFYPAIFMTALEPGEILTAIRLPRPTPGTGSAYLKLARKASDFAIVGAAAVVTVDAGGRCTGARVGVAGVGDVPYRAYAVEERLTGKVLNDDTLRQAAAAAADGIEVVEDVHASAEYRQAMAVVYVRRALERALKRASG